MKNEIANNNVGAIDVDKIKTYLETMNLTSNLTKLEVQQFVEISIAFGLNPFKREIYASKFLDKFSIIVGYETYIKRAERSGILAGWKVTTDGQMSNDSNKCTLKAIIQIHRKDWPNPFEHEVLFNEYVQRKKDGTPNRFWAEKPITMIKKVAIAQGFRLCFSDELGGLPYTKEEIDIEEGSATVIETRPLKSKPVEVKNDPEKDLIERKKQSLEEMNQANTLDELDRVFFRYIDFHANEKFVKYYENRKESINKTSTPEIEILTPEIDDNDLINKIKESKSIDDLIELIQFETRPEILKIAKAKQKKLEKQNENNNTTENENQK